MKPRTRAALLSLFLGFFTYAVLALPGMPWSARLDRGFKPWIRYPERDGLAGLYRSGAVHYYYIDK